MSVFAVALLTAASLSASDFCRDLQVDRVKGAIAMAPIPCGKLAADKCTALQSQLTACLKRSKNKVIEPGAVKALLDEHALKQMNGEDDDDKLLELVGGLGAAYVLVTEIGPDGGVALTRIVALEESGIFSAARVPIGDAPKGPLTHDTVDAAMTQLADRLAGALSRLGGGAKKRRVAVMKLSETGDIATKNGMGTLVSAELVTRFRRDHGMLVVERTRLDQVLKEFELGQSGLLDPESAPKLGKMVDAEAIVIGSVSDAGAEVKVNAQLVDVATGVTLVAESVAMKSATMISLASDAVVLRTKSGALFRSLLIPGWGQFYNRQDLKGGMLLGSVLALAGAGAAMQIAAAMATSEYTAAGPGSDFNALATRVESYRIASVVLFGAMGLVWIYNIIDAYVSGVTFDGATSVSAGGGAAFGLTPSGFGGKF